MVKCTECGKSGNVVIFAIREPPNGFRLECPSCGCTRLNHKKSFIEKVRVLLRGY